MRRLLVLVSVVVFVDAMLFGALAPLIPGYADEFDLSKGGAGVLVGAYAAGAFVDRLGEQRGFEVAAGGVGRGEEIDDHRPILQGVRQFEGERLAGEPSARL